jgi:hypothetical protein
MSNINNPQSPTGRVVTDSPQPMSSIERLSYGLKQSNSSSPGAVADCSQTLWLTVYFDGTGNNERVDVPTFEHSNVSRLHRARLPDSEAAGRYSFYVPGIGTPFREIGDEGGKFAMAVAAGGDARIAWAVEQVERRIKVAAARAQSPVNKILSINIAVFGFSRGAATARAFARRIADRCRAGGTGWSWKEGGYPTRLYFMGLFDTVASVGTPTSARKFSGEAVAAAPLVGWLPVLVASTADGHGSWAKDLRIPRMVERCIHFCAAHETRNSFPLDTVLDAGRYPSNCHESYYPGVHSNVGGGYRPGEGGRNLNRFAMLSLVPLKAMYDEAVKAGVPLASLATLDDQVRDDFLPPTAEAAKARTELSQRFNHYMSTVETGGKGVGETVRAHMRMYFRWRIVHIGRKLIAHTEGRNDWDAQRLKDYDQMLQAERQEKQAALKQREREFEAAESARGAAWSLYNRGRAQEARRVAYEQAAARAEDARWAMVHQQASVSTMPSNAETLIKALEKYDQQFLEDSAKVRAADPRTLRPFAKILREAWDMEPLSDEQIIAFFDEYVTDSLAGFDTDRTRATEHRWLYQGGDATVDYAALGTQAMETAG